MVDQLSEGLLLPPDREDLMRFAKALDKIADWTNSSARLMWFIEVPPPGNVMQHISVSTELILGGVAALREGIRAMARNDIKAALAHCEDVERLEHEADDQKRHLIGAILHAKLDPAPLLLCYNLAESLEGITDKIATAADMIKLLAVKST
jgi:predicted phosphate transport protein (TIGR00153 family)